VKRTRCKDAASALALTLAALVITACGSGDDDTSTVQPPPVSATTADRLAKLSNRIASDLDAGDVCHAAHASDDLNVAVEESDLSPSLRPGVAEVAERLVNEVNCPPPPPPPEPPEEDKKEKKDEQHKQDEGNKRGQDENRNGSGQGENKKSKPGHSDHGGFVPPGQGKLEGG
jgi:hypothetical protein